MKLKNWGSWGITENKKPVTTYGTWSRWLKKEPHASVSSNLQAQEQWKKVFKVVCSDTLYIAKENSLSSALQFLIHFILELVKAWFASRFFVCNFYFPLPPLVFSLDTNTARYFQLILLIGSSFSPSLDIFQKLVNRKLFWSPFRSWVDSLSKNGKKTSFYLLSFVLAFFSYLFYPGFKIAPFLCTLGQLVVNGSGHFKFRTVWYWDMFIIIDYLNIVHPYWRINISLIRLRCTCKTNYFAIFIQLREMYASKCRPVSLVRRWNFSFAWNLANIFKSTTSRRDDGC